VPVYQPSAIVGNSRVLVTLGDRGELMSFFYPHIDFCQNLHEGMPAVFFPDQGGLAWTFQPAWETSQRYLGRTNIVETHLRHQPTGLVVKITDFVHPSEPALFRRFEASNPTPRALRAQLYQYLDVQLGEVGQRNAVHYHPERGLGIAYWRHICFAIGPDPWEEYGCGRAAGPNSSKRQMEAGALNLQIEEIGDIDLAVGWRLTLAPGERLTRDLIIAADSSEPEAVERALAYRNLGWEALLRWARSRWQEFLRAARPVSIPADLQEGYWRSLLATDLLVDPDMGSVLAAPEFDPAFERSGGYGYCWPRDGIEVCLALDAAGYPQYMEPFLAWARRTQRPEGYWEQRYWLSGQRGPAWCTREDSLQIDQTASVLFAMGRYARRLAEQRRVGFLEAIWDSARAAAAFLAAQIEEDTGLHENAFDLWETFRGSFTYTNAAIASALLEGAFLAEQVGHQALARQWRQRSAQIKSAVMSRLWLGEVFARGLDAEGNLDTAADASALGLIAPFEFLNLEDPAEREIAGRCLTGLLRRLGTRVRGGEALRRFETDQYAGGGPGALTTVWMARVMLRLSGAYRDQPELARGYRERALASMRAVLASGTSTQLLPEMMGVMPGAHWAVPHAWTMANFILTCLLLDELTRAQA